MKLWRVDVAGISNRIVEADSSDAALALVRDEIVDALDLRASAVTGPMAGLYKGMTAAQRRRFIAVADGLASPQSRTSARSARRRLARMVKLDLRMKEWVAAQRMGPPVDPEALSRLVLSNEVRRIEEVKLRLRDWERPLYSDKADGTGYDL